MIAFLRELSGAVAVGCAKGVAGAYVFCYLEIVHHWNPLLLAAAFGGYQALAFVGKTNRRRRLSRALPQTAGRDLLCLDGGGTCAAESPVTGRHRKLAVAGSDGVLLVRPDHG